MKRTRARWPIGFLIVLAVVIGVGFFASWAEAAEVQACVSRGGPLAIGGDPAECPSGGRLDAISLKFGLSVQFPEGGGVGLLNGVAQPNPLVLAKRLDQASTRIFLDTALQRRLPSVLVVIFEQTGGQRGRRLFSILLEDAIVAAFEESAQEIRAAGLTPLEVVSFAYARITLRDDVSGETSCFDFQQSRSC
jgi:type VI protein secretion system component Hcp